MFSPLNVQPLKELNARALVSRDEVYRAARSHVSKNRDDTEETPTIVVTRRHVSRPR